jgi:hypothetical protein
MWPKVPAAGGCCRAGAAAEGPSAIAVVKAAMEEGLLLVPAGCTWCALCRPLPSSRAIMRLRGAPALDARSRPLSTDTLGSGLKPTPSLAT